MRKMYYLILGKSLEVFRIRLWSFPEKKLWKWWKSRTFESA